MDLEINQNKQKYLVMIRGTKDYSDQVEGNRSFKHVENFKYLGDKHR